MSNEKTDLVVATPRAVVIHDRPQLPVTAAASNLLIDSITATLLVVTGETGGAGVDTLVGCIVALLDGAGRGCRVIELGTTRGYLKGTLEPGEYVFVDVADPDVVANLLTAVSEVPTGYPILLSVNAGAWKDFVEIEGELAPWIERAPERYRVLVKLAEWSEDRRAEAYYRKKGGLGRVIRCFTEPRRGLRAGAGATNMRHDPEGGVLQVPRLGERLQQAFYKDKRRLSSALLEASAGEAMLLARALRLLNAGLEDVL